MDKKTKLAFVLERHPQAIYQVKSGRHAGSWTTKYYENGIRRAKIYQDKQDLIQFLYDYYQEGEESTKTFEIVYEEMLQNKTNPRALLALLNAEIGTRADEPVALHWEDVGDDVIYIHRQQLRRDDMTPITFVEVDYTKDQRCMDGKPRMFPITPRIRKILDMARELPGESVYIFHDKEGRMISKDSYEQFLYRHCKMICLSKTNNHKFRHSVNNMLIELGYSADVRAGLLGHTVRTNEMHYSHCCMNRVQQVGADIARLQAQTDSRT